MIRQKMYAKYINNGGGLGVVGLFFCNDLFVNWARKNGAVVLQRGSTSTRWTQNKNTWLQ